MTHVLNFILQHVNNMIPLSLTPTQYNSQVRVMLTPYIIPL